MTYGVFDVRDYGALGDNVADDTAAIQTAIDAAASLPSGGQVLVPPGIYYTSGVKLKRQVTLQGCGPSTVLRLKSGVAAPLISLANDTVNHTNLRDLRLRGNKYGGGGAGVAHGIQYLTGEETNKVRPAELFGFHGDAQHRIFNVTIDAVDGTGVHLFTRACHADHLHISDCTRDGLRIDGSDNKIAHFDINWIGRSGVILQGGNNVLDSGKVWYVGTDAAYNAADGYYVFGNRTRIVNCEAQDISRHALFLHGASDCQVATCLFDNIGNFKKNQNQGYDHPPIPAVNLFRYSDPRHAKNNNLSFAIGQRSAIPNLSSFVSFGTSVSNNRASFLAPREFLAAGGVPVARAAYPTTFDNVAFYNTGVA